MPAVFGKIEGSGDSVRTVLPNIVDVARSPHRSPKEVCKFFEMELGAQMHYNAKKDHAVVNGVHSDAILQDLMI